MTTEKIISGFKSTGRWYDIVKHGKHVTIALQLENVPNKEFNEWETWRPKSHECFSEDIVQKTATQASLDKNETEHASSSPITKLDTAREKFGKSIKNIATNPKKSFKMGMSGLAHTANALREGARKGLRSFEELVYHRLMTRLSPCYFDNELVSANLKEVSWVMNSHSQYALEVNINNETLKEKVDAHLTRLENECKCQHLEAEKDADYTKAIGTVGTENDRIESVTAEAMCLPYICRTCKTKFETQYHVCPNCGGYNIQRRKWCQSPCYSV